MYRFDLLNYKFTSIFLLILSYFSIAFEVSNLNNLYFILIAFLSILQNNLYYSYKKIISGIVALISFYIQFILSDYTLSKEYFLSIILILIFLKFSELEKKEDYFYYNYTCIFLGISSLLYGQDLPSSISSFVLIIISIIQLYSLNQKKILNVNFKNIFRYLLFSFSIFPIILVIYLIFPRTEINLKLFETNENNLGIPDKISLGSFEDISNSDESVFIFSPQKNLETKKYYFRVKVFNIIDENKNWISADGSQLIKQYSKNIKINLKQQSKIPFGKIIIFPHEKKWLPKLTNYSYKNQKILNNLFDNLSFSEQEIIKKTAFDLVSYKLDYLYDQELISFYTKITENISPKLKLWANNTYQNSLTKRDYLDKILNRFATSDYYYNLNPKKIGNNYEKFFFETKTGYCEYYAGVFTILSRLAGIPARIVSGYYGGEYNSLGKFYTFRQQDAHSWVEVYLDNQWVLYDPTLSIPNKNIINSNNQTFNNEVNNNELSNQDVSIYKNQIGNISIYFDYANYLWTNKFIKYDDKARTNFIENKFKNLNIVDDLYFYLIVIFLFLFFLIIFKTLIKREIYFNIFFKKIKKINNLENKNYTHQEILRNLDDKQQSNWKDIFYYYEKYKFSNNYKINFIDFIKLNLRIFRV
ncbi:transglutaminase-like domain-containing protein [Candidatus Pelagibacter communis]|uniref:transglutaminase-like domain-containing protein n=1 Tax=Pelagibacter ubique TaxID=198252 RepID=UPI00065B384C|nr:transglutaminase-like domain-containing protein [Candidatus Pelagibacter ubique]